MSPAEKLSKELNGMRKQRGVGAHKIVWHCQLRSIRESLRLSLREVAKGARVNLSTISRMEHGEEALLTNAMRLAAFFGKPVEEIWRPL